MIINKLSKLNIWFTYFFHSYYQLPFPFFINMFKNKNYFLQFQQTHVALIYSAVVMKFVEVDSVNQHHVTLLDNVHMELVVLGECVRVNLILVFIETIDWQNTLY